MATRAFNRPKRKPLSGPSSHLNVENPIKGMHYRWVNDTGDRVRRFQEAGYELVQEDGKIAVGGDDSPSTVGKVMSRRVGRETTAYLMCTPNDWYEADKRAREAEVDRSEETMKRTLNSGEDGRYGKIAIENSK